CCVFILNLRRRTISTLFPYTTLFRSPGNERVQNLAGLDRPWQRADKSARPPEGASTRHDWQTQESMSALTNTPEIVVGLDVGSTKVAAVVGEVDAEGITILGVGNVPCRGLRKGVVSNIDWTVRAIREAVSAAQTMAGVEIVSVFLGVGGSHVRSQSSDGVAAIAGREVTRADLDRVLEGARAIPVDADRMILHALPREYVVDNQDGVRDPVGMSGVRLQAKVQLVTAATSCVQNAARCAERCDLEVSEIALASVAS